MRLLLATLGSRGDIEPFLWLARAAQNSGHDVRIAIPDDADLAVADLDIVRLGRSLSAIARSDAGSQAAGLRVFREQIRPEMSHALATLVDTAMQWQPQLIVAHPKLLTVPVVAARLGIPFVWVELTPTLTPTREFPAAGITARSLGPHLNRLSYRAIRLAGAMFASDVRDARTRLGIPSTTQLPRASRSLAAISPTLLPRPDDWPISTLITGDWHKPPSALAAPDRDQPDTELRNFLADDAPFVYAGLGSMTGGDSTTRAAAVIEGARQAGLRTVLATGWGGLTPPTSSLGQDVFVARSIPHDVVLPRAIAAIHHGGAGTVHAATRAGTPSLFIPFLADQPFWAAQLRRIGLADTALPKDRLTASHVHQAISKATERATAVCEVTNQMATEDGTGTTLPILTTLI